MPGSNSDAGRSADFSLINDQLDVHPQYNTDSRDKIPQVWKLADALRFLLDRKDFDDVPEDESRGVLTKSVTRQVRTATTYGAVVHFYNAIAANTAPSNTLTVYVLLFPGEAKDNTGIKDLNDKVLGYTINSKYVVARQTEDR